MQRTILLTSVVSFVSALLGGTLALHLVAPGTVDAQGTRIQAEEIVLADERGVSRLVMGPGPGAIARYAVFTGDEPRIILGAGGPAALGGTQPLNAELRVIYPGRSGEEIIAAGRPQPAVLAGIDTNGLPHVSLFDREIRERVVIALDDDGNPSIRLLDADGNVTWSAQ